MEWLNYHHLFYFYVVAREGSISRACKKLHLAQPTISGQIRGLEESFGEKLFRRSGRNLVLTEMGRMVYGYAEEIFGLGDALMDAVRGRPSDRPQRMVAGITDVVPKLLAYRLLEPALHAAPPVRIVCQEGKLEHLLVDLALYKLDVVISDTPAEPVSNIRAYNHLLGECGVCFCAPPDLASRYRKDFPAGLSGAPMLLPAEGTTLRRSLDQWFEASEIRPRIQGEFEDSALLKVFGQQGMGIMVIPSVLESEVQRQYGVQMIGKVESIRERFYAVTVSRKLKHPAVIAMSESSRRDIFH